VDIGSRGVGDASGDGLGLAPGDGDATGRGDGCGPAGGSCPKTVNDKKKSETNTRISTRTHVDLVINGVPL
jgi:hypothetical protein